MAQRFEMRPPLNDLKWYQISMLGLIWSNEPNLMEVDGKISYFQRVTQPHFSILAQNKFNNGRD